MYRSSGEWRGPELATHPDWFLGSVQMERWWQRAQPMQILRKTWKWSQRWIHFPTHRETRGQRTGAFSLLQVFKHSLSSICDGPLGYTDSGESPGKPRWETKGKSRKTTTAIRTAQRPEWPPTTGEAGFIAKNQTKLPTAVTTWERWEPNVSAMFYLII